MKTRQFSWIIPMIGVFGLIASCGPLEEDTEDPTTFDTDTEDDVTDDEDQGGGSTMVQVDVLKIGNFFYPTGMFRCGAPEELDPEPSPGCDSGSGCDEFHWHSNVVDAIAPMKGGEPIGDTSFVFDRNPCKCGHGKVSEVTRTTIDILQLELVGYLMRENLDELPVGLDCGL